jgi:hypothetical protein
MSNNYLIQTSNLDAKIANKMLEIDAGREYLTIKAANEAALEQAIIDIKYIYSEGWNIQIFYGKQIKKEDLIELGMNPVDIGLGVWSVGTWANNHVPYDGNLTKCNGTYDGHCYYSGNNLDKMCCSCKKTGQACQFSARVNDNGCGGLLGGQTCDRTLNVNIFQKFIDRDIKLKRDTLDKSTQNAYDKYNSAKMTYMNTPEASKINVKCCQSFSIGDIIAKTNTIRDNNLICN